MFPELTLVLCFFQEELNIPKGFYVGADLRVCPG